MTQHPMSYETRLLSSFVDSFLKLNEAEQKIFDQELQKLPPEERESILRLTTSWMEEGLEKGLEQGQQEGRQEGECKLILRFIQQRFPEAIAVFEPRIRALSLEQLELLSDRLFGFEKIAELEAWFVEYVPEVAADSGTDETSTQV